MAYRFHEYRAAVLREYKHIAVKGLRHNLTHPSPAKLKDEALYACANRFKRSDEHILVKFFENRQDQAAYIAEIKITDPKEFKPLYNFIKGKTRNPEERVVELLAWLTDFSPRPYQQYVLLTPEDLKTETLPPIGLPDPDTGAEEVQTGFDGNQTPRHAINNEENEIGPLNQKKNKMPWKYALLILFVLPWALWMRRTNPPPPLPLPGSVYICDSQGAKRYHLRKNCSGLRNCKHEIIPISLDSAKKTGRTLCHLEGG